jgi:hypothetical protein
MSMRTMRFPQWRGHFLRYGYGHIAQYLGLAWRPFPGSQPRLAKASRRRSMYSISSGRRSERLAPEDEMPKPAISPSSIRTLHFPQVAFSAQTDSTEIPSPRSARRRLRPCATLPLLPRGLPSVMLRHGVIAVPSVCSDSATETCIARQVFR